MTNETRDQADSVEAHERGYTMWDSAVAMARTPMIIVVILVSSLIAVAYYEALGEFSMVVPYWIGLPICMKILRDKRSKDADHQPES